jgi:inorganic triphosphatase YgiF
MATEIELKLQLTPQATRQLAAHPLLAGIKPQRQHLLNTYYDTPDLELQQRRIALRFRKKGVQWLLTVKSGEAARGGLAQRSEWEAPASPGVFDFSHVDNPELRTWLEARAARLVPVFTTDFQRTIRIVPFGKSEIELAVDRGSVESKGRKAAICETELELVRGRLGDILALARTLQETLALRPMVASKAERGYAMFSGTPPAPFRAKVAPLNAKMTPLEAFRSIALDCLEHFQRNEQGLLVSQDPEYVHQARVALRRLRSALKLFAPALPADFVATYGETWGNLAGALGDTRNWDVFISETLPPIAAAFPRHRDTVRLQKLAVRHAATARAEVARRVALPECPRLIVDFTSALFALDDILPKKLDEFGRDRLQARARQARRLATRHAELDAEARHEMRICFKKLRYAVEFFGSLLPSQRLARYLTTLAQLQDELGMINDHVTAQALLDEALKGHPPGPVHGWIAGRHELLVYELPEALDIWLAQKAPWK